MRRRFSAGLLVLLVIIGSVLTRSNIMAQQGEDLREKVVNGQTQTDLNILDKINIVIKDSEGNPTSTPQVGDKATITFDWSIPNDVSALVNDGDYFTIDLATDFVFSKTNPPQGTLINDEGIEFGTFSVDPNTNKLTLVFNDQVSKMNDVGGNVWFEATLGPGESDLPGDRKIIIPISDGSHYELDYNLKPANSDETTISKSGVAISSDNPSSQTNPDHIKWTILVNKNYNQIDLATITDSLPAGLEVDSYQLYRNDFDLNGNDLGGSTALDGTHYSFDATNNTFTLTDVDYPVRIELMTNLTDAYIQQLEAAADKGTGSTNISNKVTLDNGDEHKETSGSVTVSYQPFLKKQKTKYDANSQTVDWKITVNGSEKPVSQGFVLSDYFSEGFELVAGSLVIKNKDGSTFTGYTLTGAGTQADPLKITFTEDFSSVLDVTYKTKAKEGYLITDNDVTLTNTASATYNGDQKTSEANQKLSSGVIDKNAGAVNYVDQTIQWSIGLNKNSYKIQAGAVLEDVYPYRGLVMDQSTFKISGVDQQDYTLSVTQDATGETGFKVTFNKAISGPINISYTTSYDRFKLADKDLSGTKDYPGAKKTFYNEATFTWKDDYTGASHTNSDNASKTLNDETANDGRKDGVYDPQTQLITWTVYLNYNAKTLTNLSMEDVIRDENANPALTDQLYAGNLKVYYFSIDKNSGQPQLGSELAADQYEASEPNGEAVYQKLTVNIKGETSSRIAVVFTTKPDAGIIKKQYTNKAIMKSDGATDQPLTGTTQYFNYGNKGVTKTGQQDGSLMNWKIALNESRSKIENAVLTDTASTNQTILYQTLKITKASVTDQYGNYTETSDVLEAGKDYTFTQQSDQSFTIAFTQTVSDILLITYQTNVVVTTDNAQVFNKAKIDGEQISDLENEQTSTPQFDVNASGGYANGQTTELKIKKTDEAGNPLAGVLLSITNSRNQVVGEKTTDVQGIVSFNVRYGTYSVRELSGLSGYLIPDSLTDGSMTVVVSEETKDLDIDLNIVNEKNHLVIEKIDGASGDQLTGAVFTLEKQNDSGAYVFVQTIEMTSGVFTLDGIDAGQYRLTETQAPEGYMLNTEPYTFSIDNTGGIAKTINAAIKNWQGTVTLTKSNNAGEPLEGVTFDLQDASGKVLQKDLKTDAQGLLTVTGLQPGSYQLVETASVDGYLFDPTPMPFTVSESAEGQPATINLNAVNTRASIQFVKRNTDGTVLSGAVFTLTNSDGESYQAVSNAQGAVHFDGIKAGTWTLTETQAPEGYLRDRTVRTVVVGPQQPENNLITLDDWVNAQGSVELTKTNDEHQALAGVTFRLLDANQQVLQADLQTDASGKLVIDHLAPGNYYLQETDSVDGYLVNDQLIAFTIAAESEGLPEVVRLDMMNSRATIRFVKQDVNGQPLEGAIFSLTSEDGSIRYEAVSDAKGQVVFAGIASGQWRLAEVSAPSGYLIDTTERTVLVGRDEAENLTLSLDAWTNWQGSVQLTKTDESGNPLGGVVFELQDEDGKTLLKDLKTDANGQLLLTQLAPGNYQLVEMKSVLGFLMDGKAIAFTIANEAAGEPETVQLGAVNTLATIRFVKQDENGQPLSGSVFALTNEQQSLTYEATSDDQGVVSFAGIGAGTWFLSEVSAPDGYLLDRTIRTIEVGPLAPEQGVLTLDPWINWQGSLEILKVDEKGHALNGVTFNIETEAGTIIRQALVSDAQGRILVAGLAPGQYRLRETATLEGYIRAEAISFTIASEATGEPEVVTLTVVNKKQPLLPDTAKQTIDSSWLIWIMVLGFMFVSGGLWVRKKHH